MKFRTPVLLALSALLALAGCSTPTATPESSPSASGSASAESTTGTTGTPPTVDRDPQGDLPTITFDGAGIPTMETTPTDPPADISVKTLKAGDGDEVAEGAYVKVNYAGFLWSDGSQFDSSYDRGESTSFSLNQVVDGWKYGLAGTRVGDQVQIVVPPVYGYGDQDSGTIPAGSTLVFVVDVLGSTAITTDALAAATATEAELPAGLTVEGDLGSQPSLVYADGSTAPAESQIIVLSEGAGAEITEADTVFYHMVGGYWGGETEVDWEVGYQQVPSANAIELLGKKVGSRVLLIYPADESNTEAQVLVLDLLASVPA